MSAHRIYVASSCIAAMAFSAEEGILQLEFRNGLTYEYFDVPAEIYTQLCSAESKGAFVTRFIRGHFSFRRLPRSDVLTQ